MALRKIDTGNHQFVSAHQGMVVILGTVPKSMTKQNALQFAAWLQVVAQTIEDPDCPEMGDIINAIENT